MALTPAENPPHLRDLKGIIEEIQADGELDIWYFVTSYDNLASARDSAHKLGVRYPDMKVRADKGSVLARRKR